MSLEFFRNTFIVSPVLQQLWASKAEGGKKTSMMYPLNRWAGRACFPVMYWKTLYKLVPKAVTQLNKLLVPWSVSWFFVWFGFAAVVGFGLKNYMVFQSFISSCNRIMPSDVSSQWLIICINFSLLLADSAGVFVPCSYYTENLA